MPVHAIVDNFDYGVTICEIAGQFELATDRVEAIVVYAMSHRIARPVTLSLKTAHFSRPVKASCSATQGRYDFIEMPLPSKRRRSQD
jgi:hypothetical protein